MECSQGLFQAVCTFSHTLTKRGLVPRLLMPWLVFSLHYQGQDSHATVMGTKG